MDQYKNILVHSMVNLGDVLLSTSAVALLRQIYPQAKITMMVRPAVAQIVINNPVIDEVIIYDYKGKNRSVKSMLAMIGELRKRKFDCCVSFDRKLRPALLALFAGIPVRVGPEKVFDDKPSWVTNLYTHVIPIKHDLVNTLQGQTYQEIIRGFTKTSGSAVPMMSRIMPEHEQKAEKLLQSLPVIASETKQSLYRIALCVKGTFPLKDWPKERFAQLIDELSIQYEAVFFIIGAPEDRNYADQVIDLIKIPVANFCGETNLPEVAAVLKRSDLFITVDTGAAHIAATVGVPMVVIYGCTSPKRWHPISERAVAISSDEPCCPCAIVADACPDHACMNHISVDRVMETIKGVALV
ncbi:glycosyltransferase family 9 protein [Pelosinus propionicus]|uniref:Heptosyltransferase-2 n=1 Tax=Pelosinus propionicus DSM 13327 TaxID=1123291 RepID=A0A1I4MQM8_9FIRM|nr:glycosyltransferase family 9 protein [Pelosinus propionicus]SFM05380.1 heptosyltransferase-2 [Pelosinus propionicus DSM 13327]